MVFKAFKQVCFKAAVVHPFFKMSIVQILQNKSSALKAERGSVDVSPLSRQ